MREEFFAIMTIRPLETGLSSVHNQHILLIRCSIWVGVCHVFYRSAYCLQFQHMITFFS